MKKTISLIVLFILSACAIKPDTPIPAINPVIFEKEGGTINVTILSTFKLIYDESLGYTEKDYYDNEVYKYGIVDCGWVSFKHFPYYITYDIEITTIPNKTGHDRSLTMNLQDKFNGKESGISSITVIQKGN